MGESHQPVMPVHGGSRLRGGGHEANIFPCMRYAILVVVALLGGACRARPGEKRLARDTTDLAGRFPLVRDSTDSVGRTPRVVKDVAVVVFWLRAADTLPTDDQAAAFEDLRSYTDQVAPTLAANGIALLATRSDTVYIARPDNQRRVIVLSGLDYPYGYVLVDPGGPERILTGVYSDDDLLDELRAYYDLSDDSTSAVPRATT